MRRLGWGHAICFTIAVTCVWVAGIVMSGAHAAEAFDPRGCAHAIERPWVRAECRAHGWTVRPWLVVSPHRVVREYDIVPCTFADGSPLPCGWNIGRPGLAYWVDRIRRVHYVWGRKPAPVATGVAHWATRSERRALGITKACWVEHPARDRWVHQCPTDEAY